MALLIDMDNREITISTCGIAIRYLTDSRIDNILDAAYAKISNGDYNGCMHSMLTGVETYYEKGFQRDSTIMTPRRGRFPDTMF